MNVVLHWWWWVQFLHPGSATPAGPHVTGGSYWFWSGIGSGGPWLMLSFAPIIYWKHHNCHVRGCWRTGHIDPYNHHPACKHHHSHASLLGVAPDSVVGNKPMTDSA